MTCACFPTSRNFIIVHTWALHYAKSRCIHDENCILVQEEKYKEEDSSTNDTWNTGYDLNRVEA